MHSKNLQAKKGLALAEMVYILKPYRFVLGRVLLMSIVLAVLNMSVPYLLKITIDRVIPSKEFLNLLYVLGAYLGIVAAKNTVYYFTKIRITVLGEDVAYRVRTNLFEHLHSLSVAFHKQHSPGKISSRLMQDVDSIKDFIQRELIAVLLNVLMMLVAVIMVLKLNAFLALIAMSVLPLHLLVYHYFRDTIKKFAREAKEHTGNIFGNVVEQFTGMETVKSSAAEPKEQKRFQSSMKKGMSAKISEMKYYLIQKILSDGLVGVGHMLVLGFGGYAMMRGNMKIGSFIAFYSYVGMLYPLVLQLVSQAGKFTSTAASFDRIYEIMQSQPKVKEEPNAKPHRIRAGEVEFRNVSFSYDKEYVLRDMNFRVEGGEHVLITGPSGAGKTTLLNLILRFYDPVAGQILIDGRDIRDYKLSALRRQIGFVSQDCFLFSSSVLENVRYARPKAYSRKVVEACRRADADDFIRDLPSGYYTQIGEGGVQLSVGQKQRVAIARTILRKPRILVLDEAFVSLDIESREKIGQELAAFAASRTLFMVTHNLDDFWKIDKEIKISGGTVTVC